ncbi:hypothetical protein CIL05_05185 [Virgibacillus profundi]|uniref:Uncharacterized protein n=1 Tax=Virgibacillus profundi TaxID=2024555 RepID=A0A2A2IFF2_9BACI|nr:hypothetical protein [Virgibacillus profundi]PAV30499.1 hypothetical protein CIL05_05185 [Virgibacillus profundi]PXY54671.1 hypothetical protein CIT14_05270 [Virgibacillus profundi]
MLFIIGFILIFFLLYYLFSKRVILVETVSAAIVMAIGVFSLNVGPNFNVDVIWFKVLALIAISIWSFFMVSYVISFITKRFKALHYQHLIGRFRIGTWVASTSVTVIIISKYFPLFDRVIIPLVMINTLLWLFFLAISIRAMIKIFINKLGKNVNGILFLTTVSTQSLLLMYNNVWANFNLYINEILIAIGFLFYFLCIFMIMKRYIKYNWKLIDDWGAPNCMFHGALSIIGSTIVITEVFSLSNVLIFWSVVLVIFIVHEIIEIVRGLLRVRQYGFIEGLCVYDHSQWSRIFTFCMFYTFTLKININYDISSAWVASGQQAILAYGKWVIAMLLIIEIGLLIHALWNSQRNTEIAIQNNV